MNEFVVPAINKFGFGSIKEVAGLVKMFGGKKALLVTDENLVTHSIAGKVQKVLEEAAMPYAVYSGVRPNPDTENVYEALKLFRDAACDYIISIGGGSPTDCAKAAGILASNGGVIEDYLGPNKSTVPSVPIIAINTTAGTASEISRAYIISDNQRQVKLIAKDIHALAFASINDTGLMLDLPAPITAATGMDALTHAVESYVANGSWLLTRKMAAVSVKLVLENLREVIAHPHDIKLRDAMVVAQTTGGMAFCNSGVGIAHSLAHALGSLYNLPHGLCTSIVLPHVMRYNSSKVEAEYAQLAREVFPIETQGKDDSTCVNLLVEEICHLADDVGVRPSLASLRVKREDLPALAQKALDDGNTGRNPVLPTVDDLIAILEEAY